MSSASGALVSRATNSSSMPHKAVLHIVEVKMSHDPKRQVNIPASVDVNVHIHTAAVYTACGVLPCLEFYGPVRMKLLLVKNGSPKQ